MYINPGMTGFASGDCRASAVYRTQWQSISIPFNTIYASYEHKMYWGKNLGGIGLMLANDQSGDAQYSVNDIRLSLAFHKRLGRHFLSVGAQPGFTIKQVGMTDLTYPTQYDPSTGGFNNALNNGEPGNLEDVRYLDLNAGVHWAAWVNENTAFRLGFSMIHIFQPYESFYNANYSLDTKYNIHGGVEINLSESIAVFPNGIYLKQGESQEIILGANMFLSSKGGGLKLIPGLHYRNADAIIPSFSILYGQLQVGLSYDLNTSSLKTATNQKGGVELSLIYRCFNSQIDQMKLPCERF